VLVQDLVVNRWILRVHELDNLEVWREWQFWTVGFVNVGKGKCEFNVDEVKSVNQTGCQFRMIIQRHFC
jgi:hypothetical protein